VRRRCGAVGPAKGLSWKQQYQTIKLFDKDYNEFCHTKVALTSINKG
jgi:hypothetical protein